MSGLLNSAHLTAVSIMLIIPLGVYKAPGYSISCGFLNSISEGVFVSNSQMFNVMAGHYFDQLCGDLTEAELSACDPSVLKGSLNNPLQAFRLMSIDVESEASYGSAELSKVTGVPSDWFDCERLIAPAEEVLRALGVMSLIYLSSRRNELMKYGYSVDVAEDSLSAKDTLIEVLRINSRLAAH